MSMSWNVRERRLAKGKKNPNPDDRRGDLFDLGDLGDVHLTVITTGKDKIRGGHYHLYPEEFYVISGRLEFHEGTVQNERVTEFGPDETIVTSFGVAHYAKAIEDSIMIEYRPTEIPAEAVDYKPWADLVNATR